MIELEQFVRLSKYAGERFDLVQAGGGNSSVKLDNDIMLIKASGFSLSEVELDKGYSKVVNQRIKDILNNNKLLFIEEKSEKDLYAATLINEVVYESLNRPSIETFLHSLLYQYTLHTHPLVVNSITCRKDWREVLSKLFKNVLLVDYKTPGVELAIELKNSLHSYYKLNKQNPNVIFLQNHGLIVSYESMEEVIRVTEEIVLKIEKYLEVDMSKYRFVTKISNYVNSIENSYYVAYLSNDVEINKLLNTKKGLFETSPFCPDGMVYCGVRPFIIDNINENDSLKEFIKCYGHPKVIIYGNNIFFIGQSLRKAKEVEDVFKFHIMSLDFAGHRINFLSGEELSYLGNWEAEKYRQKI